MNGNAATRRTLSALALCLAASVATSVTALAAQPRESAPVTEYEPAESLEGNFLSAYIAGASKDTSAAASFYREAVKADPRNAELLERAFVSLLADGALPDAFRAAERLTARDGSNGLAQLSLGVRQIKAGQFAQARQNFARSGRGAAADLTSTLLTAWAYAGANDGKRALEVVNKLKGERSYNTFPRLPCRVDRQPRRRSGGSGAPAQGRLRRRPEYPAHRRCLCPVRSAGRPYGPRHPGLYRLRSTAAAPPDRA